MNRLKELRQENGLTQKELATKLNLTQRNISYWEKGTEINAYAAITLSNFFDVTIEYLLGLEDELGNKKDSATYEIYSTEEKQIIKNYRLLAPELQKMITETIKTFLKSDHNTNLKKTSKK